MYNQIYKRINFLTFAKSSFLYTYDFSDPDKVKVFTKNRRLWYFLASVYILNFLVSVFHSYVNDNYYRLYITDFICTLNKCKFINDKSNNFYII